MKKPTRPNITPVIMAKDCDSIFPRNIPIQKPLKPPIMGTKTLTGKPDLFENKKLRSAKTNTSPIPRQQTSPISLNISIISYISCPETVFPRSYSRKSFSEIYIMKYRNIG